MQSSAKTQAVASNNRSDHKKTKNERPISSDKREASSIQSKRSVDPALAGRQASPDTKGLSRDDLHRLYYFMVLNRAFDDRISLLYRQGKIFGGAYGSRGQEATSVGSAYALQDGDVIVPMIRNTGAILVRGISPGRFLANYMGKVTGPMRGRDGTSHLGDMSLGVIPPISHLGVGIPTMAGAALAFKMRGEKRVAMTWIGDGGASTGDFYEGLNFAAVFQVPLVVIVEDNGYAYSTPVSQQTRNRDFYKRAEIFGIPGTVTDGNDVLAVYEATKQAVERARRGKGSSLIEVKTFRMKGHAEHDDASYVPKEVFEEWTKKDPIQRFEKFLLSEKLATSSGLEEIRKRVQDEILEAQKFAEDSPYPDPATVADGVYS